MKHTIVTITIEMNDNTDIIDAATVERKQIGEWLESTSYDKRYGYHHCKVHGLLIEALKAGLPIKELF